MGDIEHWPGEQIDGPDGQMWVHRSEAMAVSRSLGASNDEIIRLRDQLAGAVEALREWVAASDALRAVDTSDRQAIRDALTRVDAAKATARRLGGQ